MLPPFVLLQRSISRNLTFVPLRLLPSILRNRRFSSDVRPKQKHFSWAYYGEPDGSPRYYRIVPEKPFIITGAMVRAATLDDFDEMGAQIRARVEIDGVTVPVKSDDANDLGAVVPTSRVHNQEKFLQVAPIKIPSNVNRTFNTNLDIEQTVVYMTARSNAFNRIALDVELGTHTVGIKAALTMFGDYTVLDTDVVREIVGKRTLVIEQVYLFPNEDVDPYTP